MMSLTFGLFTQVSDSGPQGPLVKPIACKNCHFYTAESHIFFGKLSSPDLILIRRLSESLALARSTEGLVHFPGEILFLPTFATCKQTV